MLRPVVLLIALTLATAITMPAQSERADVIPTVPDMNGRAIELRKPDFPQAATAAGADGEGVVLKVVVDETGHVASATCSLACHPMLKDAAELAAMTSKFKPLIVNGKPVKYQGTLQYTFAVSRVDWFRFGTALESVRQFDNISFGPVAQILTSEHQKEKDLLARADGDGGADYDARQKVIAEVEKSIRAKLSAQDKWRFDLALALRRTTFWMMSDRIDLGAMHKALTDLAPLIDSAPEGTSKEVLADIRSLSQVRIEPGAKPQQVMQTISGLARRITLALR
jgi:TonB family protein